MWSKESSSVDKSYLMTMEKFFRMQALPRSDSRDVSSTQNVASEVIIDDDD